VPRGGSRPGAGRRTKWNHEPTVTIRIPKTFKDKVLKYARTLDSGVSDPLATKSKTSVTNSMSLVTKSNNLVSQSKGLVTKSKSQYLTTREAYGVAVSRGCEKTKNGFRSWSRRDPGQCLTLYGLKLLERDPSDKSNVIPSYEDTLFQ
jgi:hypothetical protein